MLEPLEPPRPMAFGTMIHTCVELFWRNRAEEIEACLKGWDVEESERDNATWLIERYIRHYGEDRKRTTVIATEFPFTVPLPSGAYNLRGWVDRVVVREGLVGLVETKTMSTLNRLDILTIDPQITIYYYGLTTAGFKIDFVEFDAIYTYRWKKDRPLQDSFKRIIIDRDMKHVDQAIREVEQACFYIDRMEQEQGPRLRHIIPYGPWSCFGCSFQQPCEENLRGFEEDEQFLLDTEYKKKEGDIR